MKNADKIILMMIAVALFTACTNHSDDHSAKDTVGNRYGADTAKIEKMNKDTAAVTDKTGDATNVDNSGSGGAGIVKDTIPMKAEPQKK